MAPILDIQVEMGTFKNTFRKEVTTDPDTP
jgi:hypothetical protein